MSSAARLTSNPVKRERLDKLAFTHTRDIHLPDDHPLVGKTENDSPLRELALLPEALDCHGYGLAVDHLTRHHSPLRHIYLTDAPDDWRLLSRVECDRTDAGGTDVQPDVYCH